MAMADMLEVAGQLDGPAEELEHDAQSIAGTEATETFSTGAEGFYNSKKSGTWKKFKKMVGGTKHSKAHGEVGGIGQLRHYSSTAVAADLDVAQLSSICSAT
jgi:hypothetical protein